MLTQNFEQSLKKSLKNFTMQTFIQLLLIMAYIMDIHVLHSLIQKAIKSIFQHQMEPYYIFVLEIQEKRKKLSSNLSYKTIHAWMH
jgi:hypothetical protein